MANGLLFKQLHGFELELTYYLYFFVTLTGSTGVLVHYSIDCLFCK
jgi:hypothetical protein